jgi:hypothetical protein
VQAGAALGVFVLFAAVRLVHLLRRPPFFDELFTVWIARFPPDHILEALLHDSGPPLYYLLVHVLTGADPSVVAARLISFAAAVALLAAVLASRRLGPAALVAGLLLAVFAPHVHFSAEARAYAVAGALAGGGCLALAAWSAEGKRARLVLGSILLVLAASAHYYGVLFFAIPFALGLLARNRARIVDGLVASVAAGVAYLPGFLLAFRQPAGALEWMHAAGRAPAPLAPFAHLAFAADYPDVFIAPPPPQVHLLALAVTIAIVAIGARSQEARRWGVMTLVPVFLVAAVGLARDSVYFPVRFESMIAGPFVVWLAVSLGSVRRRWLRGALATLAVVIGLFSSFVGLVTSVTRPPDAWRDAAAFVKSKVPATIPIVASRYAYLEVVSQKRADWDPAVTAYPRELERHPGWASATPARLLAAELPPPPFVWVGERGSPEHRALASRFVLRPLMVGRGLLVAEATRER